MTKCKECGAQISTKATACPHCGAKHKPTSGCAVTLLVIFLGTIVLMVMMHACSGMKPGSRSSDSSTSASKALQGKKADPVAALAESKHLVEVVEKRLKDNSEKLKKYYATAEQGAQAADDLEKLAIVEGLYKDSKVKEEKDLAAKAKSLGQRVAQQRRLLYASALEEIFVKGGMDVEVSVSGANKDQLRLKYVLMSKPLVYKLRNNFNIPKHAKNMGFKKIVYTDGYNESWTDKL